MYINKTSRIVKLPIDLIVYVIAFINTFRSPNLNNLNNRNSLSDRNSLRILSAEMKLLLPPKSRLISASENTTIQASKRVKASPTKTSVGKARILRRISAKKITVKIRFIVSRKSVSPSDGNGYRSIAKNTVFRRTRAITKVLKAGDAAILYKNC